MLKGIKIKFFAVALLLLVSYAAYSTVTYLQEFTFDEDRALQRWKKMILNGEVTYALMKSGSNGFFSTGTKPIFRLETREGYTVRLTADHMVARASSVQRGRVCREWIQVRDMFPGDKLVLCDSTDWPLNVQ